MDFFLKGLAALLLLADASAGANHWQKLPPLPQPNSGCACGLADGQIVVVGGTNWEGGQKHWLKTVYRLDPASPRWVPLTPLDRPLAYALAGTIGRRLVLAGGSTGEAPFPGTIEVADGRVSVHPDRGLGVPAVTCAGGLMGDEFVWAGGTDDAANVQGFRRDAFAWNISTGARRRLPDYPGPALGGADAVIVGDQMLIFGGCTWDPPAQSVANFPEAYAYSLRQNAWRRLRPFPYAVRGLAMVRLDDDHVYLAGGYKSDAEGFVDRGFVYSLREDRYRPAAALPYSGCVSLLAAGGYIYCIGGEDGRKHRADAVNRIGISQLTP